MLTVAPEQSQPGTNSLINHLLSLDTATQCYVAVDTPTVVESDRRILIAQQNVVVGARQLMIV